MWKKTPRYGKKDKEDVSKSQPLSSSVPKPMPTPQPRDRRKSITDPFYSPRVPSAPGSGSVIQSENMTPELREWDLLSKKTSMFLSCTEYLTVKNHKIYFVSFDCRYLSRPPYEFCSNTANHYLSTIAMERFDPDLVIIGMYNMRLMDDVEAVRGDDVKLKEAWRQFWHERVNIEFKGIKYTFIDTAVPWTQPMRSQITLDPAQMCDVLVYAKHDDKNTIPAVISRVGFTSHVGHEGWAYAVRFEYQHSSMAVCCVGDMLDPMDCLEEFYDANEIAEKLREVKSVKHFRAKIMEVTPIRVHQRNQLIQMLKSLKWTKNEQNRDNQSVYQVSFRWDDHPFQFLCGSRDLRATAVHELTHLESSLLQLDKNTYRALGLSFLKDNPIKNPLRFIQSLDVRYNREAAIKQLRNKFGIPNQLLSDPECLEAFPNGSDHINAKVKDVFIDAATGSDGPNLVACEAAYIDANIVCYNARAQQHFAPQAERLMMLALQGFPPSHYAGQNNAVIIDAPEEINFGTIRKGTASAKFTITIHNTLDVDTGIPIGYMMFGHNTKTGKMLTIDMYSRHSPNPRRNVVAVETQEETKDVISTPQTSKSSGGGLLKDFGKSWKNANKFLRPPLKMFTHESITDDIQSTEANGSETGPPTEAVLIKSYSQGGDYQSDYSSSTLDERDTHQMLPDTVRRKLNQTNHKREKNQKIKNANQSSDSLDSSPKPIEVTEIDLCEHLIVRPSFTTVLPGASLEIQVQLLIDETVPLRPETPVEIPDIHLIIRCKEACVDQIVICKADKYEPHLIGTSLMDYRALDHTEPMTMLEERNLSGLFGDGSTEERQRVKDFINQENAQLNMSIISQCEPHEKLPVPKEIWWLFEHAFTKLQQEAVDLSTGDAEPIRFDRAIRFVDPSALPDIYHDDKPLPFVLAHFLSYCHLDVPNHSLRSALEIQTLQFSMEKGYKIPQAVSVYSCLFYLKQWCSALPAPLVLHHNLVCWIDCDDMNRHDLCNAFLWSVPPYTRNVLVLILSLCRDLLCQHKHRQTMFVQRWFREFNDTFGYMPTEPNLEDDESLSTSHEDDFQGGRYFRTQEERDFKVAGFTLYDSFEDDVNNWESSIILYTKVMADWIASFVVEGVQECPEISRRAHDIICHFLVTPEHSYHDYAAGNYDE